MMPSREDMVTKLQGTGLLGVAPQTDRFYNKFVDSVAGSEKVGMGLNMAWELAKFDTLQGLPPMMGVILDMNFDRVIDTVTPDSDVAQAAKHARDEVREAMKKGGL